MSTTTPIITYVKGDPTTQKLGDCPFCHRVLLTLEQKQVPYTLTMIDFDNKPEWLMTASGGKVPVIQETPGGSFIPDSDVITVLLEDKYPAPPMKATAPPTLGSKLFPSFRGWLLGPAAEAAAKEADLAAELRALDSYLKSHGGPLFGGSTLDATDAAVAPKLYHCIVALKHFKGWELPGELTALRRYMDHLVTLPAWKATDYGADSIIQGWTRHMRHAH